MKTKYKAKKVNGKKQDYHRWVMEQHLGRKLHSDEEVHHIDKNPRNNDVSNLTIMTKSEHARLHGKERGFPAWARELAIEKNLGSVSPKRKLTEQDVAYIKEHYIPRDHEYGSRALGRRFCIDHKTILEIVSGEAYTHF